MSELTGSNHRCRAQFKCVQTVVGQHFAGNGPNGLSYYYYYYYYYYYHVVIIVIELLRSCDIYICKYNNFNDYSCNKIVHVFSCMLLCKIQYETYDIIHYYYYRFFDCWVTLFFVCADLLCIYLNLNIRRIYISIKEKG